MIPWDLGNLALIPWPKGNRSTKDILYDSFDQWEPSVDSLAEREPLSDSLGSWEFGTDSLAERESVHDR